ncbi:molecular chaperone [Cedecea neteri]|uniref:fimbrial biogenesis chaperone n=1 Tax=Cedecea neteri TaxID=158822 RepID=UPI002AA85B02|nr:molecular chaperone [Cedecea neteri]WPU21035.1 molecular chaperone [Cedecea neteri]
MPAKLNLFMAAIALMAITLPATAGVIIGGTRVVYDGARKETSISVRNPDKTAPYLMQSWVENASESDTSKPPFIVTPPLFRLDAGKENMLRIVRTGGNLPTDRESIYWLNIKSIPASDKTDENQLLISVKARLKLIYRPEGLKGDANEAWKTLNFTRQGGKLQVTNPTPYYISFQMIKVGAQEVEIKDSATLSPMGSLSWTLPAGATGKISWKAINDYGGITEEASTPQ